MIIRSTHATVEVWTPAKLNLFLEVLSRRSDGFHEIETLMVALNVYDTLTFAVAEGEPTLSARWCPGLASRDVAAPSTEGGSQWGDLPQSEANLALRAVKLLRERTGETRGGHIELTKRIPSAAGLGGASSDAAAALAAANLGWGLGWSAAQLMQLAAEIGSDVPFFLGASAALCRGRGEQVAAIKNLPPLCLVVVRPPEGLATADVYRACLPASRPQAAAPLVAALARADYAAAGKLMTNRLEPAAASLSPWPARLRSEFQRLGLPGCQLTGSGSSYFGLCQNMAQARRAGRVLAGRGLGHVMVARTAPSLEIAA